MSVKTDLPPRPSRIPWIFAAVLSLLTLVALWATAMRVRHEKLVSRGLVEEPEVAPAQNPRIRIGPGGFDRSALDNVTGGTVDVELDPGYKDEDLRELRENILAHKASARLVVGDARTVRFPLRRDEPLQIEHFVLKRGGGLSIHDRAGRLLVEYPSLPPGREFGWQELRLKVVDDPFFEARIAPSAPCVGAGRYAALRTGLRVELPGGRAVTVTAWDPAKPELTVRIDRGAETATRTLGPDLDALGIRVRLEGSTLVVE